MFYFGSREKSCTWLICIKRHVGLYFQDGTRSSMIAWCRCWLWCRHDNAIWKSVMKSVWCLFMSMSGCFYFCQQISETLCSLNILHINIALTTMCGPWGIFFPLQLRFWSLHSAPFLRIFLFLIFFFKINIRQFEVMRERSVGCAGTWESWEAV